MGFETTKVKNKIALSGRVGILIKLINNSNVVKKKIKVLPIYK